MPLNVRMIFPSFTTPTFIPAFALFCRMALYFRGCKGAVILLLWGISACLSPAYGQMNGKLKLDVIEKQVTDSFNVYYYPSLVQRFLANDSLLKTKDYLMLYIGYTYQPAYHPKEQNKMEDSLAGLFRAANYKEVVRLGVPYLADNPLSLSSNFDVGLAFQAMHVPDRAKVYLDRGLNVFKAIEYTGTGSTQEDAFLVTGGKDPYTLMGILKLHSVRTDIVRKDTISYKVMNIRIGPKQTKKMFFIVTLYERGLLKDKAKDMGLPGLQIVPVHKEKPKKEGN